MKQIHNNWTTRELALLKELRLAGVPYAEIAPQLPAHTIASIRTIGGYHCPRRRIDWVAVTEAHVFRTAYGWERLRPACAAIRL